MAKDFRHTALSWRQVLGILLFIATGMLALVASSPLNDARPKEVEILRTGLWIACFTCAALSLFFFLWHAMQVRRPDLHPDILAQIFGQDGVSEMDSLHFWGAGTQVGPRVRVLILLQNVYTDRCSGRLQLNPVGTTTRIPQASLPIEFELAGAEVLALWRDVPYPIPPTAELSFGIDGFIRKNNSPRVRFKRRIAIRSESTSNALLIAGLFAGHIAYHPGSRLNIKLTPLTEGSLSMESSTEWVTVSLWSPEEPRDASSIGIMIQKLLTE